MKHYKVYYTNNLTGINERIEANNSIVSANNKEHAIYKVKRTFNSWKSFLWLYENASVFVIKH